MFGGIIFFCVYLTLINLMGGGVPKFVTVCVPGTGNCQVIDHVQIDTGSVGLRILSSVLTLPLPRQSDANGNPLLECAQFADGFSWGPVATADMQIAGEKASSLPVQVIGDPASPAIPFS